jgi:hypothetical protein
MSILDQMLQASGIGAGYSPQEIGYGPEIGARGPRGGGGGGGPGLVAPGTPSGVQQGGQGTLRRVICGIPITDIGIGATVDVTVTLSELFQLQKLMLSVAAQALHVAQITTGTKPLNIARNPISGNAFSEQAINNDLSGYTAVPGTGITLTVFNSTAAIVKLSGGFFGWSVL